MSTTTVKTGPKNATAKVTTTGRTTKTDSTKTDSTKTDSTKTDSAKAGAAKGRRTATAPKATAEIDRSGSTVSGRFTLRGLSSFEVSDATKPLFAAVGVADLAIEQVKDVPADVRAEAERVQARLSDVPSRVQTLPKQVKGYRSDVEDRVIDLYSKLAVRGERLVTQIRRQPATEAAIAEGKEAVRKAEAAAVAARHAAHAGEQAVEDAAAKIG